MFRITEEPSSGSLVQCLAKNYKAGSIVSVDMDKVGFMAAYSDPLCVCSSLYREALLYGIPCGHRVPRDPPDRTILAIFTQALYKAP